MNIYPPPQQKLDPFKFYANMRLSNPIAYDEKVFLNPDKFDITRSPHGHSHVGFGHGIHFCLGAPLARLEGKIALQVILKRLSNLRFDYEEGTELVEGLPQNIKPLHSIFFHGVSSLPLKFG